MTPPPAPDELRRRAERALPPQAPEALRSALRHARLRLEPDVQSWDTSTGHVRAHRVGFGTDPATLALLRRSPSLLELLCEVLASAFAEGHSLFDLRPFWALAPGAGPHPGEPPWRDVDPGNDDALLAAALAYLEALGEEPSRHWLESAGLTSWPEGKALRIELYGHGRVASAPIERALTDLLQGFEGRRRTISIRINPR
ncbi:MAG TPA: hypothetical protein VFS43_33385 [Polyangiaceae bacterium]|nr:hypothetical protein [Polyangiaceae bacterium]